MKRIVQLFITIVCLLGLAMTITARAEESSPFDSGRFSITPFGAHKITEFGKSTGKWGGGLALGYQVANNIGIEASALSYQLEDSPVINSVDEAAVNFKGYLPLGKSFAPYGLLGYTRDIAEDRNLMNAGAGLSVRIKAIELFADGQYRTDFERRGNEVLFRVGAGIGF